MQKNVEKCLVEIEKKYESKGKKENMAHKEAGKGFLLHACTQSEHAITIVVTCMCQRLLQWYIFR